MIIYENEYNKLKKEVESHENELWVILISGDYGKGKSTLIDQVLKTNTCERLYVKHYPGMVTPYEPFTSALSQMLENKGYETINRNIELSQREYIKQQFINVCRWTNNLIIVFKDLKDYDIYSISLLIEIIEYLKNQNISCGIILEYSSNDLSLLQHDQLIDLEKICTALIIKLDSKDSRIFKRYVEMLLKDKCRIDTKNIDNIIKESFFNPAFIDKMIHHFKDNGILYLDNGYWYCDDMDFYITRKLFEEHIINRYNNLDPELKPVLKNASITGYEIDIDLLSYPLGLVKAEENLRRIERLSRLITHTEQVYLFETGTVRDVIHRSISESEQRAQHLLIAEYLYNKVKNIRGTKRDNLNYLSLLYKISTHYFCANENISALHLLSTYIHHAYRQRNYEAALNGIEEYCCQSGERWLLEKLFFMRLKVQIASLQGKFYLAWNTLLDINTLNVPCEYENTFKYEQAYCLFNIGHYEEAIISAEKIVEKFERKLHHDLYLQIKVCMLLSGMYHHIGNMRMAERRYEQARQLSRNHKAYQLEYCHLLSISNMFYADELAIPKIKESIFYFKTNDLPLSYAKATNNIAISYIFQNQYDEAIIQLQESIHNFNNFCSISVHYPMNNLATILAIQGDYVGAVELLESAKKFHPEPFSDIWISINMAHCKRLLGDLSECRQILNNVKEDIDHIQENTLYLQRNMHIAYSLLELDEKNYMDAYNSIILALEIEITYLCNDTYPIYLSKLLLNTTKILGKPIPDLIKPYASSNTTPHIKYLLDTRAHWGHLLFWEI